MVDVIKSLGFEYVAANPGSSFRGLHESLINYGGNKMPELLTCCHEESSVAMAHGYAKIEGKPMMVMAHGTVGLQHASMAIYNAYADRVPVYIVARQHSGRRPGAAAMWNGRTACRTRRRWFAITPSGTTRRFRLAHFAESAVRAYKIAMTPPMEPVVIVADAVCRKSRCRKPTADAAHSEADAGVAAAGDSGAVAEAAKMLVAAENPVIVAGRVGAHSGRHEAAGRAGGDAAGPGAAIAASA